MSSEGMLNRMAYKSTFILLRVPSLSIGSDAVSGIGTFSDSELISKMWNETKPPRTKPATQNRPWPNHDYTEIDRKMQSMEYSVNATKQNTMKSDCSAWLVAVHDWLPEIEMWSILNWLCTAPRDRAYSMRKWRHNVNKGPWCRRECHFWLEIRTWTGGMWSNCWASVRARPMK